MGLMVMDTISWLNMRSYDEISTKVTVGYKFRHSALMMTYMSSKVFLVK